MNDRIRRPDNVQLGNYFVLSSYGGEYEDSWERQIAISKDIDKLIARANKIIEDIDKENSFVNEANDLRKLMYTTFHPPMWTGLLKDIPKWRSGISEAEITPAMRQERNDIKEYNQNLIDEHNNLRKDWLTRYWRPVIMTLAEEYGKTLEINDDYIPEYFDEVEAPRFNIEGIEEL